MTIIVIKSIVVQRMFVTILGLDQNTEKISES